VKDTNEAKKTAAVRESAKQAAEAAPMKRPKAEALVWTERMVAALVNGVKGGKWFGLIDKVYAPKTLELAWQKVRANHGAAGVDGQSVKAFGANAAKYLEELGQEIRENRYRPQPVKRVEIPKSDGKKRPLGIPSVKDRIVQAATKMVIEPIFEHQFLDMSYGFRPGRGCKDALREVDGLIKDGYTFVVDADLKGYFDSIPQDKLLERIKERISDGRVIDLIDSWLKQDVMHGMERWTPTGGTPQGAVVSPLLANVYLHPLDEAIRMDGYRMVRYADDFVILCRTREEAEAALEKVRTWVTANGLTLHPDKTRVGNCANWGEGFDFLGYRFEAGRRTVREKSLKAFKDKVRGKTRRTQGRSLNAIIVDLNPVLRGWFEYFKHARPKTFETLDGFIRRRLRAVLRKREKRPGFGHNFDDHTRWPNTFFAEEGLFALYTARQTASCPR
jgi:RNA-directed DNA polymerase